MGDEYIKRIDVLIKLEIAYDMARVDQKLPISDLQHEVNLIKAADVQPVKHGRWIDGCCEIECSCCNTRYHDDIINMCYDWSNDKINYCPNCGARMDGEQND